MNARIVLVLVSLLAVLALSCSDGNTNPLSVDPTDTTRSNQWVFGEDLELTIIAGQNIEVGTLTVSNDYDYLYFDIQLDSPWLMTETHLHVANDFDGIPVNKKGNPRPGWFDWHMDFDPMAGSYTYEIPVGDWEAGDTVAFALHLVVNNGEQEETGWAGCYSFEGKRWGYWCEYTLDECEIELPGCTGDYQAKYYYPGSLGYWDVEFFNVPAGFDIYNGVWPGWCIQKYVYAYPNTMYDICAYSSFDIDSLPPSLQAINWEAVAWILNHKHPDATVMDIQHAIWHFTDGFNPTDPEALAMIADADANSPGYYPGPGEAMAVVLFVNGNVQAIFVEVEIGCV